MQDLFLVNEYFTSKYYHFYIEKKRKEKQEKKRKAGIDLSYCLQNCILKEDQEGCCMASLKRKDCDKVMIKVYHLKFVESCCQPASYTSSNSLCLLFSPHYSQSRLLSACGHLSPCQVCSVRSLKLSHNKIEQTARKIALFFSIFHIFSAAVLKMFWQYGLHQRNECSEESPKTNKGTCYWQIQFLSNFSKCFEKEQTALSLIEKQTLSPLSSYSPQMTVLQSGDRGGA